MSHQKHLPKMRRHSVSMKSHSRKDSTPTTGTFPRATAANSNSLIASMVPSRADEIIQNAPWQLSAENIGPGQCAYHCSTHNIIRSSFLKATHHFFSAMANFTIVAPTVDHEASRNRIEWLASLNTESKPGKNYRRTSIICTIGPKTNSAEKINMLRRGILAPDLS